MTRTHRYMVIYIAALVAAVGLVALLLAYVQNFGVLIAIAVAALVPGRAGAVALRDLFRSRSLAAEDRYQEAAVAAERFLETVRRQPWRRHFIYFFFGFYTWDVEAMALNNLGVARMHLGDLDQADTALAAALDRDRDYPIPYFNRAMIAYVRERTEEGNALLAAAKQRGFADDRIVRIVAQVSEAYARFQARV